MTGEIIIYRTPQHFVVAATDTHAHRMPNMYAAMPALSYGQDEAEFKPVFLKQLLGLSTAAAVILGALGSCERTAEERRALGNDEPAPRHSTAKPWCDPKEDPANCTDA